MFSPIFCGHRPLVQALAYISGDERDALTATLDRARRIADADLPRSAAAARSAPRIASVFREKQFVKEVQLIDDVRKQWRRNKPLGEMVASARSSAGSENTIVDSSRR